MIHRSFKINEIMRYARITKGVSTILALKGSMVGKNSSRAPPTPILLLKHHLFGCSNQLIPVWPYFLTKYYNITESLPLT
jgi:hypothetical protein